MRAGITATCRDFSRPNNCSSLAATTGESCAVNTVSRFCFSNAVSDVASGSPSGAGANARHSAQTAMANADAAFESVQKAARQAVSLAETNLKTLSETAAKATGRR